MAMSEENFKIFKYVSGMSNGYFVIGENGSYAVDTGFETGKDTAIRYINEAGLKPSDIKLIVITHGHVDHFMNINALAEVTNAPVLCHKNAARFIEEGLLPEVDLIGRTEKGRKILKKQHEEGGPAGFVPKHKIEFTIGDSDFDLNQFGLPGKIVFTPGHSKGCISVVVKDEAIVGDLFCAPANTDDVGMPFFTYEGAPFVEAEESLQKLLDLGVERFYPGHGNERNRKFVVETLEKEKISLDI